MKQKQLVFLSDSEQSTLKLSTMSLQTTEAGSHGECRPHFLASPEIVTFTYEIDEAL